MARFATLVAAIFLFTPTVVAAPIGNPEPDVHTYAYTEALAHHLDPVLFEQVIGCESKWNTAAVGDQGTSFGIAQIHIPAHPDISKEEALSPYFSIHWMAGEWVAGRAWEWSCYRRMVPEAM